MFRRTQSWVWLSLQSTRFMIPFSAGIRKMRHLNITTILCETGLPPLFSRTSETWNLALIEGTRRDLALAINSLLPGTFTHGREPDWCLTRRKVLKVLVLVR